MVEHRRRAIERMSPTLNLGLVESANVCTGLTPTPDCMVPFVYELTEVEPQEGALGGLPIHHSWKQVLRIRAGIVCRRTLAYRMHCDVSGVCRLLAPTSVASAAVVASGQCNHHYGPAGRPSDDYFDHGVHRVDRKAT